MLIRLRSRFLKPRLPQTLSSLDAYEQWAANYPPHAHNALMQAEEAAMHKLMPTLKDQIVLDLACGTGRYGLIAQGQGAKQVIAFDNSPPMLKANALPEKALATTEAIPLPDASIDVVLCGLALGHLPQLAPSMREIGRVLKPGGWALISDFHPFIFLNGQRRTFTAPDGKVYAVEHYVHLYSDYHQAAGGLRVDALLEPRLGQDKTVRFVDDGTREGTPVIIAYRFQKLP